MEEISNLNNDRVLAYVPLLFPAEFHASPSSEFKFVDGTALDIVVSFAFCKICLV